MNSKTKTLFLLDDNSREAIYGPTLEAEAASMSDLYPVFLSHANFRDHLPALREVEVILSGWGMTLMNQEFLDATPNLKVLLYGAGTIRPFITPEAWDRGIRICTAARFNAVPVAEYVLSQILFGLKNGWAHARQYREARGRVSVPVKGAYESVVGLLGFGFIARLVARHLRNFDVEIIAYDPFVSPADAEGLNVKLVSMEEVFSTADIVSCHIPLMAETEQMLGAEHFSRMKPDTTFINSGRGAVVRERELIQVLQERPDLTAVLDVTWPEPPEPSSPFFTLPNVVLTPHIAGSGGNECRRMGRAMLDELGRYQRAEPFQNEVTREAASRMA